MIILRSLNASEIQVPTVGIEIPTNPAEIPGERRFHALTSAWEGGCYHASLELGAFPILFSIPPAAVRISGFLQDEWGRMGARIFFARDQEGNFPPTVPSTWVQNVSVSCQIEELREGSGEDPRRPFPQLSSLQSGLGREGRKISRRCYCEFLVRSRRGLLQSKIALEPSLPPHPPPGARPRHMRMSGTQQRPEAANPANGAAPKYKVIEVVTNSGSDGRLIRNLTLLKKSTSALSIVSGKTAPASRSIFQLTIPDFVRQP